MSVQQTFGNETTDRPLWRSIWRGARSRCPHCAEGKLFRGWLKPVERCVTCDEDYTPQRSDDLPPYLVIFVVGHLVVAGYLAGERFLDLTSWQHLAIWTPVTLALCITLMRPTKGGTIGLQWALRMHGFGKHDGDVGPEEAAGSVIYRHDS